MFLIKNDEKYFKNINLGIILRILIRSLHNPIKNINLGVILRILI
jgi:hypothetical protein